MELRGRAAIVTGSATGIGRSTALELARRGCNVVINYTRSEVEAKETVRDVEAAGAAALLCRCNVSEDAEVRRMVAACAEKFGRLDVLVNAAGVSHFSPPEDLEAITEDVWNRIFRVNVHGTFLATRAAAPLLKRSGQGAVVNVSSIAGVRPAAQAIPYAASKAAVVNMAQGLAEEWAADGIRVNAVSPERTDTPMRRRAFPNESMVGLLSARDVALATLQLIRSDLTGQVLDIRRHDAVAQAAGDVASPVDATR